MFSELDNCRKCEASITTLDDVCPKCHHPTGHGNQAAVIGIQLLGLGFAVALVVLFYYAP